MDKYNSQYEIGLNINFLSSTLPKAIIKDKDKVEISITTLPEKNHQYFSMNWKQLRFIGHTLAINITDLTKKIIVVFRKKNLLTKDQIIASNIIHANDFPDISQRVEKQNLEKIKTEVKIMNLFEPIQQKHKSKREKHSEFFESQCQYSEIPNDKKNREIIGEMQVQLSFTEKIVESEQEHSRKENNKKNSRKLNDDSNSQNKNFQDLMKYRF